MSLITKNQAEKVAEWWANKTFDAAFSQDIGDDANIILMAMMSVDTMEAREKSPDNAREVFKKVIIEYLLKCESYSQLNLDVDYHPNEPLRDACIAAGISTKALPVKSFTFYHSDKGMFEGKFRYGGSFEIIA